MVIMVVAGGCGRDTRRFARTISRQATSDAVDVIRKCQAGISGRIGMCVAADVGAEAVDARSFASIGIDTIDMDDETV